MSEEIPVLSLEFFPNLESQTLNLKTTRSSDLKTFPTQRAIGKKEKSKAHKRFLPDFFLLTCAPGEFLK
ncbi:hypothetical protein JWG44_02610 [Leptospira sp. 201903071]|uniref:hypothetical protein n=1 Tax=Leptospira ainazelensis TaxID=2810034 RepID=UPI0019641AEA|nr:hypothetical protein [Leptospira ainazelensis]MBM9499146.1 hypothetical protein [Leptospira ainazelensis]